MMSMRKRISGRTPSEIKRMKREEFDLPVTTTDFQEALSRCKKSVTASDVAKYEQWIQQYGSC